MGSVDVADDPYLFDAEGLPPDPESIDEMEFWADLEGDLAGDPPAGYPSEELVHGLRLAARGIGRTVLDAPDRARVCDATIASSLTSMGDLRLQLDGGAFSLALEAATRGLHTEVGLSLVDWLRHHCTWLTREDAARVWSVVRVAQTHWGAALGEALTRGETSLYRASKVAACLLRVAASLNPDQREAYARIVIPAASHRQLSDQDLSKVCGKLLTDLLDEQLPGERERTTYELRYASQRSIGEGLTRFTIDAPDDAAATLAGIFTCPLAAPVPAEDGTADLRSPAQRRYDALIAVVNRGLSNPGAAPSAARAAVILTIGFDPVTGRPTGPAWTPTGEHVSVRQAELLTCSGEITPVWMSPEGEPLKLGRTARFASPGQWKALVVRDRHCTFPGCTVPPQWCDTHHLLYWSRGGQTNLEAMGLLCGHHHTYVHLHDLVATVSGDTLTWHL